MSGPIVAGIDPSLNSTGFVIPGVVEYLIRPDRKLSKPVRLHGRNVVLSRLVAEYGVTHAVFETPAWNAGGNRRVIKDKENTNSGQWHVITCWAVSMGLAFTSQTSNRARKFATGNGATVKREIAKAATLAAVADNYEPAPTRPARSSALTSDDLADAYVLACMGMEALRMVHPFGPLAPKQAAVLDEFEWHSVPDEALLLPL